MQALVVERSFEQDCDLGDELLVLLQSPDMFLLRR